MHYLPHEGLIQIVKLIGYPGIFAVIFLESGVFFGFFLPGSSILFTAGILSSQGFFSPWVLIPLITFAAILGDSAGYWFGNKVGVALFLRKDSKWFRHEHLERAKEFYDKHGTIAVALARFIPIVRTFAPIIAGVVNMRYRTFLAYNVLGALAWGAGVVFAGYFLGERFPLLDQYLTPIILVIIVISTIPLLWQMRKTARGDSPSP